MNREAKRIKFSHGVGFLSDDLSDYHVFQSSPDFEDMFAAAAAGEDDDGDNNSALLEVLPEDLLAAEIFPRLANSRNAIRGRAVSKNWRSLLSGAEFIPNFLRRHGRSSHAMFVEFRFQGLRSCIQQLCPRHLIVDGPKFTSRIKARYKFGGRRVVLESACDDFLLFSALVDSGTSRHLYLRNVVTRQWLELPELPKKKILSFSGLVSHPDSTHSRYSYRVVYIDRIVVEGNPEEYWYAIFSSETGQWSELAPAPIINRMPASVPLNGLLYLLDEQYLYSKRLVVFDPFSPSWRLIPFPPDLLLRGDFHRGCRVEFGPLGDRGHHGINRNRPIIGAVQGRLRLAQLFRAAGVFAIKIWELNKDNETWSAVSKEVRLKNRRDGAGWIHLFSFHPDDNDTVFLCRDCDVYGYSISRGEYQKAFRLSCAKTDEDQSFKYSLPRFARVLNVRLPPWPTTIPALPPSPAL